MTAQQFSTTILFRQLEAAIASGEHKKAAILARELALHKVACCLTYPDDCEQIKEEEPIMVNLYIEDKNLHEGPFPFLIHCNMTLGALKSKLEKEFAFPKKLQRWILGRRLAADDDMTLQDYGVTETGCSIFLYLMYCDSNENYNYLFETLSKMPKNVIVQNLWNTNGISYHKENKNIDSHIQIQSDVENILHASNINEDKDFSDEEDGYIINSTCISYVSNNDCNLEEHIETDELEDHDLTQFRNFTPDYKEIEVNEESANEHSSSTDFVTRVGLPEEQESTLFNYEQNRNEFNINEINEFDIDSNKGEIIHTREENVNSHSTDIKAALVSVTGFMSDTEDDREELTRKEQTRELLSANYIPILREKKQKEMVTEQELYNHSFDVESIDSTHDLYSNAERKQFNEENEVTYFNANDEYINVLNKEQDEDLSKSKSAEIPASVSISQQRIQFEKQEEMEDKEEQHGYLPVMKYIAVINEFDAEAGEDECVCEENQIKFAYTYSIPTLMHLSEQKVKDLHNAVQIQISSICLPRIHDIDERMERRATEEEEQHGYLPNMEYIATINELDTEAEEEYEENQIEYLKTEPIQVLLVSEGRQPRISTDHITNERREQNANVACILCGSLCVSQNNICEICKSPVHNENIDREDNTNKNAETLLAERSTDCSKEVITDYQLLVQLDNQDLIPNAELFGCPVCFINIQERHGVVLRDCLHQFCKDCLAGCIEHAESTIIKCPFRNEEYSCDSHLQEREIKALVTTEVFERYVHRGMIAAEGRTDNSFHCKMPDCPGWCILDDISSTFQCPTCSNINCLKCQAIHEGLDCLQYQEELEYQLARNEEVKETKNYLDSMVKEGKAMLCPKCDAFVIKRWGCDWLKCSVCQTEICWITKKTRWGPKAHGDTSDGCKCGVNGQRCHPKCNYCH